MPKINQTIVPVPGGAKRLMVRGKGRLKVKDFFDRKLDTSQRWATWVDVNKMVPLNGPYIGTTKKPKANAKKHPLTKEPQTTYVLVQHPRRLYVENIHAVPPSDVEFYWQKGQVKNGRFRPDKEENEVTPLPGPPPAQPTP